MTDVFIQSLYFMFLPVFTLAMLVSLTFALSRGRIVLKFAVGAGLLGAIALLVFGLTVPYAGMVYFHVMIWLGPALMAGAVALLLTSEHLKTHKVQHIVLSALIVGGPFGLGHIIDTVSKTRADQKAKEQKENEPALRKRSVTVGLGQHRLYVPLGSERITVNPENAELKSIRKYDDAKALEKLAKHAKKPVRLQAIYFSGDKPKTCLRENFQNPAFWCDFEPVHEHFAFNVMWGGKTTRPSYKTEATQEPDERGLIPIPTSSKRSRHFVLPSARTKDAIGHPLYLVCRPPHSKGTRMECNLNFLVTKTVKVSVMQVRGDEKDMADIVLKIQNDAEYILTELQKKP